jgi:hypothetical protein
LKQDIFLPLLDALKERQDRGELWITDHISCHKYEKERDGGTVKVLTSMPEKIVVIKLLRERAGRTTAKK